MPGERRKQLEKLDAMRREYNPKVLGEKYQNFHESVELTTVMYAEQRVVMGPSFVSEMTCQRTLKRLPHGGFGMPKMFLYKYFIDLHY